MTEKEWFASDWPDDLLEHVCSLREIALGITDSSDDQRPDYRPRVYPRKRRLFISACCRRIWELLPTSGREAVDVAERFADGQASDAQRIAAIAQVEAAGKAYLLAAGGAEGMAFRRRRDDWSEFLRQHAEELRACGVPDEVSRNRLRFFVFLDHGFDEWGWATSPHAFFDSRILSDEQVARLAAFVAEHFGEQYRIPIASRWQRDW